MESYTPVDLFTAGMTLVYKTLSQQRGINSQAEWDPIGDLSPRFSFYYSPNIFRFIDSRMGHGDRRAHY